MARIKLDLPEEYLFTTEIPIYISHINYGNHLGHDSVLSLAHEARVRFFQAYGYTEMDVEGYGLILADAAVVYKSEAFYGDTLVIQVALTDFSASGCDICYWIVNKDTGKEVARAKTGIVFYNYQTRRPVAMPKAFRQRFAFTSDQSDSEEGQ